MMKPIHTTGLSIGIDLLQIFDIVIHVATDQAEPIRIASNVIVLAWLAPLAMGWFKTKFLRLSLVFIGIYLILNLTFLATDGLTNEAQGGGLRIMLLVLITLTVALTTALAALVRREQNRQRVVGQVPA